MEFTYHNLRDCYLQGAQLGEWKGYNVYACAKEALRNKGNGVVFIVFDDSNALVRKTSNTWYKYGYVSESGMVSEHSPKTYLIDEYVYEAKWETKPKEVYCHDTETFELPAAEEEKEQPAAVVADVKLEIDVDATLKAAREMTVSSLLEGFNYGLE